MMKAELLAVGALLSLGACAESEGTFRMVQFCLSDPGEVEAMTETLRTVAMSHGLKFHDRSAQTEAELASIAEDLPDLKIAHPSVNIGTGGRMGFSAANFPETPTQIVVSFSSGDDLRLSKQLSDSVVQSLASRWRVHEVPNPETSGAFPLERCDS